MDWIDKKYAPDSMAELFKNLYSYFEGDLQKCLEELFKPIGGEAKFKEIYRLIVNSHGFEDSFF